LLKFAFFLKIWYSISRLKKGEIFNE
jgi:hypothetical protein